MIKNSFIDQKKTQAQKEADDFAWYKENCDVIDSISFKSMSTSDVYTEFRKMKINYDLYNNKLNKEDLEYVAGKWVEGMAVPAKITNYDILSGKINTLLGMEMRRPFKWHIAAVNQDAVTRKEKEERKRLEEYVISQIMGPIEQEEVMKAQMEMSGKELTPQEKQQIAQQIQQRVQAQTPEEVQKYMAREYKDPQETLGNHLMNYELRRLDLKTVFGQATKHAAIAGKPIIFVGESNGKPVCRPINPLYFDHDRSPDIDTIEDGEWACAEFRMMPSDVVAMFDLTSDEIDEVYQGISSFASPKNEMFWDFTIEPTDTAYQNGYVRVIHTVWKSLCRIGILKTKNAEGETEEKFVNESYKINKPAGDISIEWLWIPRVEECYKIGTKIYKGMGAIPYQLRDTDDLYCAKLPYYGAVMDNMNSPVTSIADRIRPYQYYYNIIMYRIENLMASDQGKKILMNMNALPNSLGIDTKKFMYFFKTDNIGWLNPAEEGNLNPGFDVTNLAKEIDLSLASDISRYWQMAEAIKQAAGDAVGITPQMEGQIQEREAVRNVETSLSLSNNKLEPFFDTMSRVKRNVLQALIDTAKAVYARSQPKVLSYILDDYSKATLELDPEMLENAKYGVFVMDSSKATEIQQQLTNLAHAAMQTQTVDLSTIMEVFSSESIHEAKELLKEGERSKRQEMMQAQTADYEKQKELAMLQDELAAKAHEREKELVVLKESERRKTEVSKAAITAVGFDEEDDRNKNNVSDTVEYAGALLEADKFEHQKKMDEKQSEMQMKEIELKGKEIAQKANQKKS